MSRPELRPFPPARLSSLLAPAEWPLLEDRAAVAGLPAAIVAERIANQLPTDHDKDQVAGVASELVAGSTQDPHLSHEDALRLAYGAHLVEGASWVAVPKLGEHQLPGTDQVVADQVLAMDPDAHTENVAGIAQSTNPDLDGYAATNTVLALQNTDWSGVSPEGRANLLALLGPVLGQLGVGMHTLPPQIGEGQ